MARGPPGEGGRSAGGDATGAPRRVAPAGGGRLVLTVAQGRGVGLGPTEVTADKVLNLLGGGAEGAGEGGLAFGGQVPTDGAGGEWAPMADLTVPARRGLWRGGRGGGRGGGSGGRGGGGIVLEVGCGRVVVVKVVAVGAVAVGVTVFVVV